MNRYENGKIYKITDIGYNKCYIGSTCEKLSKRMERHREGYSRYNRGKAKTRLSVFDLFDEFGSENCKAELIEDYPCNSREELLRREGHYIKNVDCLNKVIPHRTEQERKDVALEYYYNNKEQILEKRLEKVECPYCHRVMSQYYVPLHQRSKNCTKPSEENNE
eukprot:Skav217386  [mRNA]  locus=scaffold532:105398:105889:+ [translate_table: standard]